MVLKSIGVLSAAKIVGFMYAVLGLVMGLIFAAIFSLIPAVAGGNSDMPGWLAPMFGMGAIVIMPIFYGCMGFIGGALGAVIYNALAGMMGGLELRLEATTRPYGTLLGSQSVDRIDLRRAPRRQQAREQSRPRAAAAPRSASTSRRRASRRTARSRARCSRAAPASVRPSEPTHASTAQCRTTAAATPDGRAPSVRRIASSRFRSATDHENSPYTPSAARNAASAPNVVSVVISRRGSAVRARKLSPHVSIFPTGVFGDTAFSAFLSAASAVAVSRAAIATVTAPNGNCRVG